MATTLTSVLSTPNNLPLSFRFSVLFLAGGAIPNPMDILFQKVSGLGASVETMEVKEGGQHLYSQTVPVRVKHDNLVLERGMVLRSPLSTELHLSLSHFKFNPSNVLITLYDSGRMPMAAWLLRKAYPIRWRISDLDANENRLVIETIELSYQTLQVMPL